MLETLVWLKESFCFNLYVITENLSFTIKHAPIHIGAKIDLSGLKEIVSKEDQKLRLLLRSENVLWEVEQGISIVIIEGKSITDLDAMVKKGEKVVVVPTGPLFGG